MKRIISIFLVCLFIHFESAALFANAKKCGKNYEKIYTLEDQLRAEGVPLKLGLGFIVGWGLTFGMMNYVHSVQEPSPGRVVVISTSRTPAEYQLEKNGFSFSETEAPNGGRLLNMNGTLSEMIETLKTSPHAPATINFEKTGLAGNLKGLVVSPNSSDLVLTYDLMPKEGGLSQLVLRFKKAGREWKYQGIAFLNDRAEDVASQSFSPDPSSSSKD